MARTSLLKSEKSAAHSPAPFQAACNMSCFHGAPPPHPSLPLCTDYTATTLPQPAATSSILLCTSMASRGLDLPLTALAGKDSKVWSIVKGKMRGDMMGENPDGDKINITLEGARIEGVLAKDFSSNGTEYEERATEVQLLWNSGFCSAKRTLNSPAEHSVRT
ncbi:hypothetical protein DFH29DRAFT_967587 [Suillus ampliporus]|nr:hypothetical protein DFH29DRAFT_967587 [Suillus ampliporus]